MRLACGEFLHFDMFFATEELDASVYMHVDDAHYTKQTIASAPDWISTSEIARIDDHLARCIRNGWCDEFGDGWQVQIALADLTQTPAFFRTPRTGAFPTLLKNSVPWDLVTNQVVPASARWLVMGWPHPAGTGSGQHFPSQWPSVLEEHSRKDEIGRIGNGMHVQQVGIFVLWTLISSGGQP